MLLSRMKARLVEVGWTRGPVFLDGRRCVLMVLDDRDWSGPWAILALQATTGDACDGVPHHNDHCLQSEAEALDWLDRAMHWAKEQA